MPGSRNWPLPVPLAPQDSSCPPPLATAAEAKIVKPRTATTAVLNQRVRDQLFIRFPSPVALIDRSIVSDPVLIDVNIGESQRDRNVKGRALARPFGAASIPEGSSCL